MVSALFYKVSGCPHSRLLACRWRTHACGARMVFLFICTKCAKRILCRWKGYELSSCDFMDILAPALTHIVAGAWDQKRFHTDGL